MREGYVFFYICEEPSATFSVSVLYNGCVSTKEESDSILY